MCLEEIFKRYYKCLCLKDISFCVCTCGKSAETLITVTILYYYMCYTKRLWCYNKT